MKNIKIIEIKKLLTKKNFEGATLFIENAYTETEKTSEILNIFIYPLKVTMIEFFIYSKK